MTRKELVLSDGYIEASIECIAQSRIPIRLIRKELSDFFIRYRDEILTLTIEEYKTSIENLIEAIPGQTDDKDWWPDNLTDAVNEANKLLENKKKPE